MFTLPKPSPRAGSLFSMARSKLHSVSAGARDNSSLHRWVLLKNSLVRSTPSDPHTYAAAQPREQEEEEPCTCAPALEDEEDEMVEAEAESDSFLFPYGDALVSRDKTADASEAQWLDSLLDALGDAETQPDPEMDVQVSVLAVDEDEDEDDQPVSPFLSPASSSDDLVDPAFYRPANLPTAVPLPNPSPVSIATPFAHSVTYPALLHPPLVCPLDYFASDSDSPVELEPIALDMDLDLAPAFADAPLPFTDYAPWVDDVEDMPVPDAVEDTSDDESDAPLTPWGRSTASLAFQLQLPFVDPASVPLPTEPRVFVDDAEAGAFLRPFAFELDPLPFARTFDERSAAHYQEC